jgi:hypothetical protein
VFERFADDARETVVLAQEEARAFGHPSIGTEHLLLGALRASGGAGAQLDVELEDVRGAVLQRLGRGTCTDSAIPFTGAAKAAFEAALREALARGDEQVRVGHLLLALVELDGASELLGEAGVDARGVLAAMAAAPPRPAPAAPAGRLDPRDPGPPITVALDGELLGDLGNPRVDARLLLALVLRGGRVAQWLATQGIDEAALRERYGAMGLGWEPPAPA